MYSTKKRFFWNRKYIIAPRFQGNFVFSILILTLLMVVILYGVNYYFLWKFYSQHSVKVTLQESEILEILTEQFQLINTYFIFTSIIISLILIIASIIISHRVAGPLFRLARHMKSTAQGEEPKEIQFRKKDHFKELADAYNTQLNFFNSKIKKLESISKSSKEL